MNYYASTIHPRATWPEAEIAKTAPVALGQDAPRLFQALPAICTREPCALLCNAPNLGAFQHWPMPDALLRESGHLKPPPMNMPFVLSRTEGRGNVGWPHRDPVRG